MDAEPTWDWEAVRPDTPFDGVKPDYPTPKDDAQPTNSDETKQQKPQQEPQQKPQHHASSGRRQQRTYGPRTCRICLDTEHPIYPDESSAFGISETSSKPTYVSSDPELGRLLSPCKCRGSQKYVHEGCLSAWRLANPTAQRNYWQCPTCKFEYRMARLHWAAILSSRVVQVALTFVLLVASIYILGWIADPILDLWFDPVGTVTGTIQSIVFDIEALEQPRDRGPPVTWSEHFLKGFLSLGIVGFFKTVFVLTPWDLLNLRSTGLLRGSRRGGRGRMENMNLVFVIVGAIAFLMGIWKMVKALSTRVLKKVSDRVMDVGGDDDDDADEPTAM